MTVYHVFEVHYQATPEFGLSAASSFKGVVSSMENKCQLPVTGCVFPFGCKFNLYKEKRTKTISLPTGIILYLRSALLHLSWDSDKRIIR